MDAVALTQTLFGVHQCPPVTSPSCSGMPKALVIMASVSGSLGRLSAPLWSFMALPCLRRVSPVSCTLYFNLGLSDVLSCFKREFTVHKMRPFTHTQFRGWESAKGCATVTRASPRTSLSPQKEGPCPPSHPPHGTFSGSLSLRDSVPTFLSVSVRVSACESHCRSHTCSVFLCVCICLPLSFRKGHRPIQENK